MIKLKKTPALSFYEWLVLFRGVDRPIGDLAQDALRDPDFPKHKNFEEIRDHLQAKHASQEALKTLDDSYVYYKLDELL
ncbi:MAG: sterile alpha motif-like domain-containing protein [Prevotella sp.]